MKRKLHVLIQFEVCDRHSLQGLHISFRSANRIVTGTVKDVNADNRKIVLLQDDPPAEKKYSVDYLDSLRQRAAAART